MITYKHKYKTNKNIQLKIKKFKIGNVRMGHVTTVVKMAIILIDAHMTTEEMKAW